MGIATRYVESDDVLAIVWDGVVTLADWEHAVRAQLDDPSTWRQGRRRLVDLTTCDPSALDTSSVQYIVEITRERVASVAGRRQAIVAPYAWALATDFAARSTQLGATTIVFDHIDAACAWLGVDPAAIRPILTVLRADLRVQDG
jgi:hypothetical protein